MYRAVTLYCIQNNLFEGGKLDKERLQNEINGIKVEFRINKETGLPDTYLNGTIVESAIRTMEVSSRVSEVSAILLCVMPWSPYSRKWAKPKG